MKKYIYIVPMTITVLAITGYVIVLNKKQATEPVRAIDARVTVQPLPQPTAQEDEDHAQDDEHGAILAGTRIDLQNSNRLQPGSVKLAFKLYGLDTHEFGPDDLKITHEKPMHLILVRDDVTGFQHLHPEYQDGRWTVKTTIVNQGLYQMYVDIEPTEEGPATLRVPLIVGGPTEHAQFPEASVNMSVMVGGVQAALQPASPIKTQEHINLTFALTQNGKPVTQIDPYLGAFGHMVAFRHGDVDDYLHGHPITESKPTDGKITFESEFISKGMYTVFAQFNINGQVQAFPLTIEVGERDVQQKDEHMQANPINN